VNRRRYTLNKLPVGTEVVHGHFNVVKLQDKLPELNGLPIVKYRYKINHTTLCVSFAPYLR
jgi:hypothetical protein